LPEKINNKDFGGGGLFWSLLLKVKKNIYMYTKTNEIGGSLNRENMK